MPSKTNFSVRTSLSAMVIFLAPAAYAQQDAADLILTNGYIYTADAQRRVVQAVAIDDGRIVKTGRTAEVMSLAGDDTEIRDLGGKMVMPGLHDMHIHALGVVSPEMCDLDSKPMSLDELVPVLQACLETFAVAEGDWMPVLQWDPFAGNQPSARYPTMRSALDAVSTKHPIILWGNDGHHGAANSVALASAKTPIDKSSVRTVYKDLSAYIAVDTAGEPTGVLTESARNLIREDMQADMLGASTPPPKLMPKVARELNAHGITSIQDAAVSELELSHYRWLDQSGGMTFRVRTALKIPFPPGNDKEAIDAMPAVIDRLTRMRDSVDGSKYLRTDAVKIFADGVMEGNPKAHPPTLPNAAIMQGYRQPRFAAQAGPDAIDVVGYVDLDSRVCEQARKHPDRVDIAAFEKEHGYLPAQCARSFGRLEHSETLLNHYVKGVVDAGFHVHVHAIADHAIKFAADAFEANKASADSKGVTLSVAHLQLGRTEDLQRLGGIGTFTIFTYVWASPERAYDVTVIPFIDEVKGIGDMYHPRHYYYQNAYPVRALKDYGAQLVFGSDAPVSSRSPRPFASMKTALLREAEGIVLNPAQRIDIHDVIASYTTNSARLMGHQDKVGSLVPGKAADLIILDRNIVELAENGQPDQVGSTKVLTTIFDGKIVYDSAD